jgi:hypothetical protein
MSWTAGPHCRRTGGACESALYVWEVMGMDRVRAAEGVPHLLLLPADRGPHPGIIRPLCRALKREVEILEKRLLQMKGSAAASGAGAVAEGGETALGLAVASKGRGEWAGGILLDYLALPIQSTVLLAPSQYPVSVVFYFHAKAAHESRYWYGPQAVAR